MTECHAHQAAGSARQPERLVIGEFETIDAMQAGRAWIAINADATVAVEQ